MNASKFKYIKDRVEEKKRLAYAEAEKAYLKANKPPTKPASVATYEEKYKNWSNNKYKDLLNLKYEIGQTWNGLLDKAYLGEDKEILEILTK